MIALPVHLHQPRLKVGADLGEDMPQFLNRLAVEHTAAVFGDEDQMDMHCKDAVSTVPNVLEMRHRPNHNGSMERRQAFQFELLPIGDHRVAGSASPLRPRVNQPFALAANEVFLELRISDLQALAGRLNRQVWEAGSANDPVCSQRRASGRWLAIVSDPLGNEVNKSSANTTSEQATTAAAITR